MRPPGFVHLHLHTEYSMLDGAARVEEVVARGCRRRPAGGAITDHGVRARRGRLLQGGGSGWDQADHRHGGLPHPGSRFDRPPCRDDLRYPSPPLANEHLATTTWIKLASRAFLEGFYYKPRMDVELLAEYHQGLVRITGCLGVTCPNSSPLTPTGRKGTSGWRVDFEAAVAAAACTRTSSARTTSSWRSWTTGCRRSSGCCPTCWPIPAASVPRSWPRTTATTPAREEAESHDVLLCIQTGAADVGPGPLQVPAAAATG